MPTQQARACSRPATDKAYFGGLMTPAPLLRIHDLHVAAGTQPILQGISLELLPGTVHALMGPNGAGKSTLAQALAGHPAYTLTQGSLALAGQELGSLAAEERAQAGLFLAFQEPVAIPGLSMISFLQASLRQVRAARGLPPLSAPALLQRVKAQMQQLDIDPQALYAPLNDKASGGQKKRHELLQMALLEPKVAVFDEIDSGLDLDGLRKLAQLIQQVRHPERVLLFITHYPHLFDYIEPDAVHVLHQGRLVRSGGVRLAQRLAEEGYGWITAPA